MARLIYSTIMSLDGYVADEKGNFDWAAPDEEVHAFVNELERPIGTYLLGRRMYEVMAVWETWPSDESEPQVIRDYAHIWRAADKIVYSSTLSNASTPKTRIERTFDADAIRDLKARSERDLSVGGPQLATHAFRAALVDECHVFIAPVTVGGGNPSFGDGFVQLELLDERRFSGGFVHVHYRVRS